MNSPPPMDPSSKLDPKSEPTLGAWALPLPLAHGGGEVDGRGACFCQRAHPGVPIIGSSLCTSLSTTAAALHEQSPRRGGAVARPWGAGGTRPGSSSSMAATSPGSGSGAPFDPSMLSKRSSARRRASRDWSPPRRLRILTRHSPCAHSSYGGERASE